MLLPTHDSELLSSPVITRHRMSPPVQSRATLMIVLALIRVMEIPARKKQEIISGINTVVRAIGRSADLISSDLRTLSAEMKRVSPATVGLTARRLGNATSLVRTALKLVG